MAKSGDVIENPVTGQRIVFRRTSAETGQQVSEFDGLFRPGGFAGPAHVHPVQDERFEVIRGRASFMVRGEETELGEGQTLEVPKGTPHTFRNAGLEELHVRMWFHPGTPSTEEFFETFFRAGREGYANRRGMPGLLLVSLLAPEFADHVRLANPPWWVQRAAFVPLRPLARLLGYKTKAERLRATVV